MLPLNSSPLQAFDTDYFVQLGLQVFVKRDDLIDGNISGNKWRKLKYNLEHAQRQQLSPIVSFGGAYSNHLYSLAYAAKAYHIPSVGLVRGEVDDLENPTLAACRNKGMELIAIDRQTYRRRNDSEFLASWKQRFPNALFVPEGGSNELALRGCQELAEELGNRFDYWILPSASGGTIAGLASSGIATQILGIAVVKDASLPSRIEALIAESNNDKPVTPWRVLEQFTGSAYGKFTEELVDFLHQVYLKTSLPTEPIYSGKALFALYELAESGFFPKGSSIVFIHTGGMQGIGGLMQHGRLPSGFCGFKKSDFLS